MHLPKIGWRPLLWGFLLIASFVWIYKYTQMIQGFEDGPVDEEKMLRDELTTAMTTVSEILCPVIKETLVKLQNDLLTEEEKMKEFETLPSERKAQVEQAALHQMKMASMGMSQDKLLVSKDIKGLLFPCPPPSNPLEIPINIKDYILGTCRVCGPILKQIKDEIAKARSCPPKKEKFEPKIPIYIDHTTKEAFEDIEKSEDPKIKEARILSFKVKLQGIQDALKNPIVIALAADYKEIKDLKAQAEDGSLTPNCTL